MKHLDSLIAALEPATKEWQTAKGLFFEYRLSAKGYLTARRAYTLDGTRYRGGKGLERLSTLEEIAHAIANEMSDIERKLRLPASAFPFREAVSEWEKRQTDARLAHNARYIYVFLDAQKEEISLQEASTLRFVDDLLIAFKNGECSVKEGHKPSANTQRKFFLALKHIYALALVRHAEIIDFNPALNLPANLQPTGGNQIQHKIFKSIEELDEVIEAAKKNNPSYAGVIAVLAYLGIRKSEALALRWEDVDHENGRITICRMWTQSDNGMGKPGIKAGRKMENAKNRRQDRPVKPSTYAIPPKLDWVLGKDARLNAVTPFGFIFPSIENPDTQPVGNLNRALIQLANFLGFDRLSPHDFRHTYLTLVKKSGAGDPQTRLDLASHTKASTTERYEHETRELEERIQAVEELQRQAGIGW